MTDAPALSISLRLFPHPLCLPEVLGRVEPSSHSRHVSPAVNRMHSESLCSTEKRKKQNKRKKIHFPASFCRYFLPLLTAQQAALQIQEKTNRKNTLPGVFVVDKD